MNERLKLMAAIMLILGSTTTIAQDKSVEGAIMAPSEVFQRVLEQAPQPAPKAQYPLPSAVGGLYLNSDNPKDVEQAKALMSTMIQLMEQGGHPELKKLADEAKQRIQQPKTAIKDAP